MFTIYILYSLKLPRTYVGYSSDVERRLKEHNYGKVNATKKFRPWKIIYTEKVNSKTEAKKLEKYWKSGAGRRNIEKIFSGSRPTFKKVGRGSLNQKD